MSSLPNVVDAAARRERFQMLYEENYHRVLGYARRRVERDDAHDVVAETFLVAWRRLEQIPEGDAAQLWLYGAARRVLWNQQRAVRRRNRLSRRLLAEGSAQPDTGPPGSPLTGVTVAFASLRNEDRELLSLVAWEGLDPGEIAEVLGCSRNAARIRLHRARRRFARELARVDASLKRNPVAGHVSEVYD
jgi:DNA-directed RNA polymerase specialized sigma24 family protein